MAKEVRRDNKGRILRTGESQRADGRYLYKCTNALGEPVSLYSWKLVPTDKIPKGKRKDISCEKRLNSCRKTLMTVSTLRKENHGMPAL